MAVQMLDDSNLPLVVVVDDDEDEEQGEMRASC